MKYLLDGQETERLIFRKIQRSDFDQWLEFFKDPRTSEHWIEEKESPEKECTKWYEKQFSRYKNDKGGMNALIEKKGGKLIGHCGLLVQTIDNTFELEIGYSLLSEFWNRGFATEAANYCKDFAFQNELTESLISIISLTNIQSGKVAIKNGMTAEKTTTYNGNLVNIFRIKKVDWEKLTVHKE
ncbi:MAG: GNAT family N-acetyltransferase [Bacteroidetes bacterium]|nr:GNAT family N-acetyltransferase [Bacteroidota bacterium]MBI3481638.1 GNAT family N-acetyltransferase [Bacteroidota bacterium]